MVETYDIIFVNTEDSQRNRLVKFNHLKLKGFFIACLVSGLDYVHNKNIIHRDIKPENLVLDEEGNKPILIYLGYLRVTDFGIARVWRPDNSQDTSGTPGYMGKIFLIL
jgi:serine/threonine protein kinase